MVDWKRDEGVGEEYGTTSINILVSTRQKYVVITCGKNAWIAIPTVYNVQDARIVRYKTWGFQSFNRTTVVMMADKCTQRTCIWQEIRLMFYKHESPIMMLFYFTSSYNLLSIKLSADVEMVFCLPLFKVLWSYGSWRSEWRHVVLGKSVLSCHCTRSYNSWISGKVTII